MTVTTNSITVDHVVERTDQNLIHSARTASGNPWRRTPGTFRFGSRVTVREVVVTVIGELPRAWRLSSRRCRRSAS